MQFKLSSTCPHAALFFRVFFANTTWPAFIGMIQDEEFETLGNSYRFVLGS